MLRIITAVVVVAALRFGEDVFVPLTLAVLLSFLLAYPVDWLQKLKLGRVFPVIVVVLVTFSGAGEMIWIGARQLAEIVSRLPDYQENIHKKLESIRNPAGSELSRALNSIHDITEQLSPANMAIKQAQNANSGAKALVHQPSAVRPVPVQVVQNQPTIFDALGLIGGSIARVFVIASAVVVLTFFLLLRRGDLRNRLFRLFGQRRISVMTAAIDDVTQRVSRYLFAQSLVNCAFGSALGLGLFLIGVPYAVFWGTLGAALRFIPYAGTLAAGLSPFLLSLAVFDGWHKPLLVVIVFAGIELTTSSFVEPLLYSTRTGISPLAVLFSAAFWTLLWGPIGLVVSTPLTVLLFVLGRHISPLEFLSILLGDEPVLSPHAHYYQRLLAMDEDEARNVVDEYAKEHKALELYETVLMPALSLAAQDREEGRLDDRREKTIFETTRDLIEEIGENERMRVEASPLDIRLAERLSICCVPANDETDELAAIMAAQILQQTGFHAEAFSAGPAADLIVKVDAKAADAVVISALPPFAIYHARALCRKIARKRSSTRIVIALWRSTDDPKTLQSRLGAGCSDYIAQNLGDVRRQLLTVAEQLQPAHRESSEMHDEVGVK